MSELKKLLIVRNMNFGLLWFGQMVSQIGDRIFSIAVMWYILEITDSAQSASYVMFFNVAPVIMLAAFSGVIVDRISKKKIIVISDFIRGALILIMSYMYFYDKLQTIHIYGFLFISGCVTALFNPAISASIPFIVKESDVDKAIAYQSSIRDMAMLFGAGIGSILITAVGTGWAFFINGFSYIFSAFSEIPIRIRNVSVINSNTFFRDMKEGFDFVFSNITIRKMMFLFMIMNFFGPPVILIIPIIVRNAGFGVKWFAFFEIAMALGSIIGAASVGRFISRFNVKNFITVNMLFSGLFLGILGIIDNRYLILGLQFLFGLVLAYININLMIIFQKITPEHIKGRFFSILETVSCLIVPLSFIVSGITLEKYGIRYNLYIMGTAIILSSVYFYFIPGLNSDETNTKN